jgi:hypothetical protein
MSSKFVESTHHADVRVLFNKRAQQLHLLMQIRLPNLTYPLSSNALGGILATQISILRCALSKTHARLMSIQARSSAYPTQSCCCSSQTCAAETAAKAYARLEVVLLAAKDIEIVAWIGAAEAGMLLLHGLLVLLLLRVLLLLLLRWLRLLLLLLMYGLREVCERVGEIVAGKTAPALSHVVWL